MQRKLIITTLIFSMLLILTSCGQSENVNIPVSDETRNSRMVVIQNKDQLINSLFSIIQGESKAETFEFDSNDILENCEINNYYCFNGSIYVQANKYMYRFQLDINSNVESYIRYTLEH